MTSSVVSGPPPPSLLAAMTAMRAGDFSGALAAAEAGLPSSPDRKPYLALAGLAAQRLALPKQAATYLRELHQLSPADQATRGNLARALLESDQLDEALAISSGGSTVSLARTEAMVRQRQGDLAGAADAYRRALAHQGNDVACLNNLGNVLTDLGETEQAIAVFEQAITHAPEEVDLYLNLANTLRRADHGERRLKVMKDVAAIAPNNRFVLTELALAYAHCDNFDEALRRLEHVCEIFPDFGESQLELGRLYESFNRIDDLRALVERLEAVEAPPEAGFLSAWLAYREGRFDEADRLASLIPDSVHPMRRYHLIGSIAERRGNSTAAFAAFERMNRAALADAPPPPQQSYRQSIVRETKRCTKAWASSWPTSPSHPPHPTDPIFLVGFPRSGTTLLDTMLLGLPDVMVLEERPMIATLSKRIGQRDLASLTGEHIVALRQDYFALARQYDWTEDRWLIDKHPLNMARVPMIHRLFPNARFVLAERHPCDVVLSCFMANFQLNFAMRSFTTLEEAALTYDAVFSAWECASGIFNIDFKEVRYERLIVDQEAELRPLLDWLELPWHPDLLDHTQSAKKRGRVRTASYAQIGEPLYDRAKYRWKRYKDQLAPVMPILEPWIRKLGYVEP